MNTITMTPQEESLFLALLRTALWKESFEPSKYKSARWNVIVEHLMRQSVPALGAEVALKYKDELNIPQDQVLMLTKLVGYVFKENLLQNEDLVKVFSHLQQNSFHPILLKGQCNASYYPNPLTRACGDIDVYIGPSDYDRAKLLVNSLIGKKSENDTKEIIRHYEFHFNHSKIELHKDLFDWVSPFISKKGNAFVAEWLHGSKSPESLSISGYNVSVPPVQFNVLYVFMHLWHHLVEWGLGLRQIMDWTMILHSAYKNQLIDNQRLYSDLQNLGLLKPWQLVGTVAVEKLGLPKEEFPFYNEKLLSKLPCLWNLLLEEGNFGQYGERVGGSNSPLVVAKKVVGIIRRFGRLCKLTPRYALYSLYFFTYTSLQKIFGYYYPKH